MNRDAKIDLTKFFVEYTQTHLTPYDHLGAKSGYPKNRKTVYGINAYIEDKNPKTIILELTFLKNEPYCCCEPGCHFAFYSSGSWNYLRKQLKRKNIILPPNMTLKYKVTIEKGALQINEDNTGYEPIEELFQYEHEYFESNAVSH